MSSASREQAVSAVPCPPVQFADCQLTWATLLRLPVRPLATRAVSRNTTCPPAAMFTGTPLESDTPSGPVPLAGHQESDWRWKCAMAPSSVPAT